MDVLTVLLVFVLLGVGAGGAIWVMHFIGWPDRATPTESTPEAIPPATTVVEVEVERLRGDLRSWLADQQNQISQVGAHRDADLAELVTRGMNDLRRDLAARSHTELAELIDRGGIALQHELEHWLSRELAQLRTELRTVAADGNPQRRQLQERQAEVLAELYRRLAKLEWGIAAVVHPIQLPGEPIRIPEKLPADALKWDNWKDVGELAFAFADYFNQHQVLLSPPLAADLAAFVRGLRGSLTSDIYPNLQPQPNPEQVSRLREGLTTLAGALTSTRQRIEHELRQISDRPTTPIETGSPAQ